MSTPADVPGGAPRRLAPRYPLPTMDRIRIVDVTDVSTFGLLPPCADPSFDHRSCDYWEDADRGSKAHRASWLRTGEGSGPEAPAPAHRPPANPFLADLEARDDNPFALKRSTPVNLFALDDDDQLSDNPFAPKRAARPTVGPGAAPKLALLGRGLAVFGSYAKVLLVDDEDGGEHPAAYAQFGPLSAYPRALRTRELYPRLPQTPLPAIITCVAVAAEDRGRGFGQRLVVAVCEDLAGRGFAAVEAYPEIGPAPDATSAATPAFWERAGFTVVVPDERYPVVRREL
jgi:ribosomal protein S18 acetylase RimI-like enzyme